MSLDALLIHQESHQSLFEDAIRGLNVPVCDVFLSDGKYVAAQFEADTARATMSPSDPNVANEFSKSIKAHEGRVLRAVRASASITGKRVAVLFSGGPAAGGHNVVAGIFYALGSSNTLLGVKAGPKGLLQGDLFEITADQIASILNTGGFDFLGSDRTKIKTPEQFASVKKTCKDHRLDAIVVIGGDDSNTNAAVLAEYLFDDGVQVIGVPKTIDGDLQVDALVPISFGFDTATKIYAELVGNILQDTPSSRKYWHFIKLMGRSASHVALEVALQTRPAVTLISEEIEEKKMSLSAVIDSIAEVVVSRAAKGVAHGVVLVPEGVVEFIPEMRALIDELNELMASYHNDLDALVPSQKRDFIYKKLSAHSAQLMASLPDEFENMLLLDRDSHGNLQVSQIPTEKLLIEMVSERIAQWKKHPEEIPQKDYSPDDLKRIGAYKFATNNHFFGYEGRCGAPTLFDASYTLNLGLTAGSLVLSGKTGYMAGLSRLSQSASPLAVPLTGLIRMERRHGQDECVIEKALVKTTSPAFVFFSSRRADWAATDCFSSPGPRQLWGPTSKQLPISVALNQGYESLAFSIGN